MYNYNLTEKEIIENENNVVFRNDILKKMNPRDKEIFRIIVSSGVSEEKDAKEIIIETFINHHMHAISTDTAYQSIKTLSNLGLLDKIRISTG